MSQIRICFKFDIMKSALMIILLMKDFVNFCHMPFHINRLVNPFVDLTMPGFDQFLIVNG